MMTASKSTSLNESPPTCTVVVTKVFIFQSFHTEQNNIDKGHPTESGVHYETWFGEAFVF